jgi:hypothetical protein
MRDWVAVDSLARFFLLSFFHEHLVQVEGLKNCSLYLRKSSSGSLELLDLDNRLACRKDRRA